VAFAAWALAMACAGARVAPLDPSLPDGEVTALLEPRAALEAAVTVDDPVQRGLALAGMVRASSPEELPRWAMQGSYDPDAWVQGKVATALVERAGEPAARVVLQDIVSRVSADPYVRVAVWRAVEGLDLKEAVGDWRRQPAYRAAPMALLAMHAGEPGAGEVLAAALATGEVRDDAVFLAAVGSSGRADLVPSLTVGATRLEDEMAGPYAFVAALLGDGAGLRAWTAAAKDGDGLAQQDAVELLLGLAGEERRAWAAKLSAGKVAAGGLKLIRAPSGRALAKAAAGPDPWLQGLALRLLDQVPADERAVVVAAALRSSDDAVRAAACEAAATWRLSSVKAEIDAMRVDERPAVRVAAAAAASVF
jgi:hypothetical protein